MTTPNRQQCVDNPEKRHTHARTPRIIIKGAAVHIICDATVNIESRQTVGLRGIFSSSARNVLSGKQTQNTISNKSTGYRQVQQWGQLEMQHSADYKYLDNANGQNSSSSSSIRRVWLSCSVTVCSSVSFSVSVCVFISLSVCAWQLLLLFSRCFHSQLERKKRSKKQKTQKLRLCLEFFGVCLVSPPSSFPPSLSLLFGFVYLFT